MGPLFFKSALVCTPSVQIFLFGCLILKLNVFANTENHIRSSRVFHCCTVCLFWSKRLSIPHIWNRHLFTGQRVRVVTLYTKLSKQGPSRPVQQREARYLRKEAVEVHRLPLNPVSKAVGHICRWIRRTHHLEGRQHKERWCHREMKLL